MLTASILQAPPCVSSTLKESRREQRAKAGLPEELLYTTHSSWLIRLQTCITIASILWAHTFIVPVLQLEKLWDRVLTDPPTASLLLNGQAAGRAQSLGSFSQRRREWSEWVWVPFWRPASWSATSNVGAEPKSETQYHNRPQNSFLVLFLWSEGPYSPAAAAFWWLLPTLPAWWLLMDLPPSGPWPQTNFRQNPWTCPQGRLLQHERGQSSHIGIPKSEGKIWRWGLWAPAAVWFWASHTLLRASSPTTGLGQVDSEVLHSASHTSSVAPFPHSTHLWLPLEGLCFFRPHQTH